MGDLQDELKKKVLREEEKDQNTNKSEEKSMIPFYLDPEKTRLNPQWFESEAERWVEKLMEKKQRGSELKLTQLRKFYNEILVLDEKRKNNRGKFDLLLPYVKMLKSKAAYAYSGGKNSKIPENFKTFLDLMVDQVRSEEDFVAFKLIFEAIVGFCVGKGIRS